MEGEWKCRKHNLVVTPMDEGLRTCVKMRQAALADEDHYTYTKCLTCDLGDYYATLLEGEMEKPKCVGGTTEAPCEKGQVKDHLCSKHFRLKHGRGIHDPVPDKTPGEFPSEPVVQVATEKSLKDGQFVIDFLGYDELLTQVRNLAYLEMRTVDKQILWLIKNQLKPMVDIKVVYSRSQGGGADEAIGGGGEPQATGAGSGNV